MSESARALTDSMPNTIETIAQPLGFDEAFMLHHRTVFRAARSIVRDAGLAEDVTQEVFLRLYDNQDVFENEEMLRPWLIRVALNTAKNTIRGNIRANIRDE